MGGVASQSNGWVTGEKAIPVDTVYIMIRIVTRTSYTSRCLFFFRIFLLLLLLLLHLVLILIRSVSICLTPAHDNVYISDTQCVLLCVLRFLNFNGLLFPRLSFDTCRFVASDFIAAHRIEQKKHINTLAHTLSQNWIKRQLSGVTLENKTKNSIEEKEEENYKSEEIFNGA